MMIADEDLILACPHCGNFVKQKYIISYTISSHNTRIWTDGKIERDLCPETPIISYCTKCHEFYWLKDAKTINYNPEINMSVIQYVTGLSFLGYMQAIEEEFTKTIVEEKLFRIHAWRTANNAFRYGRNEPQWQYLTDKNLFAGNLLTLLNLLDENNSEDCLIKAEVLRELEEYDKSLDILTSNEFPDKKNLALNIIELCKKQDPWVRLVKKML